MAEVTRQAKVRAARDIAVNGFAVGVVLLALLTLAVTVIWSIAEGATGAAVAAGICFVFIALWKLASKK
jgi:uncharacterized membrane protein YqjE